MSKSGNLVALAAILSSNSVDQPTVFYAEDLPYLPRILIFYWPVQAVGSLASTSRIRTTILSAAGFKSYGAFQVSPSSAYYSAVHKLPEDKQRDDVCRGIAFSLCRYFSEIPSEVKTAITDQHAGLGAALKWGQGHAAQITCRLNKVTNADEIIDSLKPFSKDRPSSPTAPARPIASIRKTRPSFLPQEIPQNGGSRLGQYFGQSTPSKRVTSGSRRTPSHSTPGGIRSTPLRERKQNTEQLESLRFKMCEFVDTEDRYASRLQELVELVETQSRTAKSLSSKSTSRGEKVVNAMLQFPALLEQMRELNLSFLDDIEASLQATEESAMTFLEQSLEQPESTAKDPIGAYAFAKVLLNHFPKFPVPYREYLDLHSQISSNLDQFLKETNPSSVQRAPSLLMEPAQRISRYGLYIDTMLPQLPPTATIATRTFEKARKIIAEICEMEPAASTILDGLRIEHESRRRPLSPTKLLSTLTRSNNSTREAPSLTSNNTPRLLPGLSRNFSRKNRSRPAFPLAEQDVDQVHNIPSAPNNENARPISNGSTSVWGSVRRKRPDTAESGSSGFSTKSVPALGDMEQLKGKLARMEDENYKLLQENAELKRQIRLCTCERK